MAAHISLPSQYQPVIHIFSSYHKSYQTTWKCSRHKHITHPRSSSILTSEPRYDIIEYSDEFGKCLHDGCNGNGSIDTQTSIIIIMTTQMITQDSIPV